MTNYSAQKVKNVSLNQGGGRYAASETDDSVAIEAQKQHTSGSTSTRSASRPQINPQSEGNAKAHNQDQKNREKAAAFDWLSMFHRTYLSIYLQQKDDLVGPGLFDYLFQVGKNRIYVLVQQDGFYSDTGKTTKQELEKLKKSAASQTVTRFQQIRDRLILPNTDETEDLDTVYYVGVTSLNVQHGEQNYQIEHEYSSVFFQEDCVLDLDDEDKVLQLFSLNNFFQVVNLLQTPSDLLSYFDSYLFRLMNFKPFTNEFEVAKEYFGSPEFFSRAVAVQEKLVEIGLLEKVENRLIELTTPGAGESKTKILDKLNQYTSMFQKLLNGATKRRHNAGDTIPVNQVQLLVNESMYTRMSLMEEVIAYESRSDEECRSGYLSHQHSYNDFGVHYVIIVYGLDADAEYTKAWVEENHTNLLMDINAQLQNPAMSEYFILGIDMSNDDGKGNVAVQMDVFHQSGAVMSEVEKHFYERVKILSNK